ncbi:expressed unknown protein [Seminavis robusta]|uniref:Uncharacterized protein n=1 Tax=Seminavis robusta TaxID=568900 RepID=A0A9N8EVZ7_9STRA|nr:expressed unknown protein [Seminavis robusta]|eukprot:Sro1925_g305790.1 n/a (758) ;mRNA; r:8412-10778
MSSKVSAPPSETNKDIDKNDGGESEMSPKPERVKFDQKDEETAKEGEEEVAAPTQRIDGSQQSLQGNSVGDVTASVASSWAPPQQRRTTAMSDADSSTLPSTYHRTTRRSPKKKKVRSKKHKDESLAGRLGNSALASTLEILKLAGGATLHTTGTILSPSLELTKNVILPNLLGSAADYLSQVSPQRLKDWFRIFSASIHHLIAVIVSTERGSIFRHKVVRVGGNVVDVACSDTSRQVLMDGMAAFIKLNEAMHTPEFKSFLEQTSVLGCRVVDAAANGENKKLIHNVVDLAWSGVELVNDPATTVAFAEVAAYLCYALEMEDTAIHAIAKERSEINRTAAEKRRERDHFQAATYQDMYLLNDPNATVEEVILSAFGVIQKSVEEAKIRNAALGGGGEENDDEGIPGSVVLGSDDDGEDEEGSRAVTPPPLPATPENTAVSNDDKLAFEKPEGIGGDHNVDVRLLREKITKYSEGQRLEQLRARTAAEQKPMLTSNRQASAITDDFEDDGRKDIEDLSSLVKEENIHSQSKPTLHFESNQGGDSASNNLGSEEKPAEESSPKLPLSEGRPDRSMPLEGETPAAHFYRVLDQVLTDRREIAMKSVIPKADLDDASEEDVLDSGRMKRRLSNVRAERRTSTAPTFIHPKVAEFINENEKFVCAAFFAVIFLVLVFCMFGFYGMYAFVFPPTPKHMAAPVSHGFVGGPGELHVPIVIQEGDLRSRRSGKDEYVIRVVREVVHVNSNGEVLQHVRKHDDEL